MAFTNKNERLWLTHLSHFANVLDCQKRIKHKSSIFQAVANILNFLNKSSFAADTLYEQEIEAYMRYLSFFIDPS